MAQKSLTVHCGQCAHEWEIDMPMPMALDTFVKRTRAATSAGCPNCGARGRHILLGPVTPTPPPEVSR